MDQETTIELIVLILLLALSGFFSSAETAFTTVNRIRMRTLAEDGDKKAKKVLEITEDSSKLLSAVLIGNNIVNLSASSLSTTLAIRLFGNYAAGIATGLLTLFILVFGEITPKTMASLNAEKITKRYASVISLLMTVLTPLIIAVNFLASIVLRLLRVEQKDNKDAITEDELRTIVDVSQENGVIEDEEREFIHNIFDFTDTEVKEVMVPRIHMTFVDVNSSYKDLLQIFRESGYSRLPVYEDSIDKVVGIINAKDVFFLEKTNRFSIRKLMRDPYFTYEHKNIAELMAEMRTSSISIAIICDEYGGTVGMVSMEDLLEEIVGEIHDEYDENEEEDILEINEREYLILGMANLEDVCKELDITLDSEESDTIAGFLMEQLDHLPEEGEEVITEEGIVLRVEVMENNSILSIRVKMPEQIHAEEDDEN